MNWTEKLALLWSVNSLDWWLLYCWDIWFFKINPQNSTQILTNIMPARTCRVQAPLIWNLRLPINVLKVPPTRCTTLDHGRYQWAFNLDSSYYHSWCFLNLRLLSIQIYTSPLPRMFWHCIFEINVQMNTRNSQRKPEKSNIQRRASAVKRWYWAWIYLWAMEPLLLF